MKKKTNIRKKIDINKYSPQALIQRGLSDKILRKIYSDFRGVAKKRISALIKKGFSNVEEVKRSYFPTLREVDTKPDPKFYLRAKIFELAKFLNNPLTLLRNQKERTEIKTVRTLREHGYDVAADSSISFGKFMQMIKSRGDGLLLDSKRAVQYYEEHYLEGMKWKDIAKSYAAWQNKELGIIIENIKLMYPDKWIDKLKERDIDYEAYQRSTNNISNGLSPTSKSRRSSKKKSKRK